MRELSALAAFGSLRLRPQASLSEGGGDEVAGGSPRILSLMSISVFIFFYCLFRRAILSEFSLSMSLSLPFSQRKEGFVPRSSFVPHLLSEQLPDCFSTMFAFSAPFDSFGDSIIRPIKKV